MSIDKETLFKPRTTEDVVELDGIGTIRVRGLTRTEVFMVQQCKGTEASERKILSLGVVDPSLTEVEARRWQENSPAGEIEPVVDKIRKLSKLHDGADKESYKSVRDE